MTAPGPTHRLCALALIAGWMLLGLPDVRAAKAIDDAPAAAAEAKPAEAKADAKPAEGKADAKPTDAKPDKVGSTDAAPVNDGEVLGFNQSKVAAEMTELEERMFRLSETLRQMEPENASRLMLGLKYARDELILHQMKEAQQMLGQLKLGEAAAEEKALLLKLQRLHDLLLSADLDLQMRLDQLRALRYILRRLDKAIKEEERETQRSVDVAGIDKGVEGLRKRQASLADLIKRQTAHVDSAKPLAAAGEPNEEQVKSIAQLGQDQTATQGDAEKLASADGAKLANVDAAARHMATAAASLAEKKAAAALPEQEAALESLNKEVTDVNQQLAAAEAELAPENFAGLAKEQVGNHQVTDEITDAVQKLGDLGAGAIGSLQSATANMSGAEKDLGQRQADPASHEQASATEALKKARKALNDEAEKLLDQLRAEVKRRVLEDLNLMLERQIAVRESTAVLGPRAEKGGRQIQASIIALSRSEGRIIAVAEELISLVEETEFGIALPAALSMIRDSMTGIKGSLAGGDASEGVVAREQDVEADIKDLLTAIRQMPGSKPGSNEAADGNRARERELNRLLAELKMIRMVQIRVNRQTLQTDSTRSAELEAVSLDLKKQILNVSNQQDDVRDVTERLFLERAEELPME